MFRCGFPGCDMVLSKSLIENHHVVPREIDSRSSNKRTYPLCPLHHKLIFVPESKSGQHSRNTEESIEILNTYKSTNGQTLHYKDYTGKKYFYFLESGDIIED